MKSSVHIPVRSLLILALLLWLQGCATAGKPGSGSGDTPAPSKPATAVQPQQSGATVRPRQPAAAAQDSEPTIQPLRRIDPDAIIVLSNDSPGYREIADQLNALLDEPARVYLLSDDALLDKAIIAQVEISTSRQLIAVGLAAARALRGLSGRQVVFCEVVNYDDYDLVSANMKGVGSLPPADKLFADWKRLSPRLTRVLVVTGAGLEDYIERARNAARRHRIELAHMVVDTDAEFLEAARQNTGAHQGQWILADDRVPGDATLRQTIALNTRHGVQTVVFSPQSLAYGGLFYAAPSKREISRKVIERFRQAHSSRRIDGEGVIMPDSYEIGINAEAASRLGVVIPEELRRFVRRN